MQLSFTNRTQWRTWLTKNQDKESEVWLVYYKKHTKKPTISYDDAVEEALCYGWIDGKVRTIDEERYMQRFTPRKPDSLWSLINKKRVLKLIEEKKMTPIGMELIKEAKKRVTGRSFAFGLENGVKVTDFRELRKCGCNKGWRGTKRCIECNGTGFKEKIEL